MHIMKNQQSMDILNIFLLFLTVQVQADPTFNYIKLIDSKASRPSGSTGGYVDRKDKFFVEFSFTRTPADAERFPDYYIYPQIEELNPGNWGPIRGCTYDASLCPQTPGQCYCKNRTGNDYFFVYNPTAAIGHSGLKFRTVWDTKKWVHLPVTTAELVLPIVCSQINITATIQDQRTTLSLGTTNEVEMTQGPATLTFTVDKLVPGYTITLKREGSEIKSATNETTVATSVTAADVGKTFSVSYSESRTSPACGRSYQLVLKPKTRPGPGKPKTRPGPGKPKTRPGPGKPKTRPGPGKPKTRPGPAISSSAKNYTRDSGIAHISAGAGLMAFARPWPLTMMAVLHSALLNRLVF